MIFTAIGLLVVALVFLIAGIAKSSVALLVLSVVATVAAVGSLLASFALYRRAALAAAGAPEAAGRPGWPVAYGGAAAAAPAVVHHAPGTNGSSALRPEVVPPVAGWDDLSAMDAAALVETLNLDELHDARRYEVEHDARKTVLRAIDQRIESIVELRRRVRAEG